MKLKWLRVHPEVAKEYGKLNKDVVARSANNIDQYCGESETHRICGSQMANERQLCKSLNG